MEIGIAFDALTFLITGLLALTIMDARTKQSKDVEKEIVKGVWVAFKKFGAKLRIDRDWAEILELTKESLWMRIWLSSNIGFSLTASIASTCLPIVLLKTYSSSQVGIYSKWLYSWVELLLF